MKRKNPEKKVQELGFHKLDKWKGLGFVIDYDDVSKLGVRQVNGKWRNDNEPGKRDAIVVIKVINIAWLYLIEWKEPNGGDWSIEQQKYSKRFAWLDNVIYEVVSDPNQIDNTIGELVGYTPEKLMNL